MGEGEIRGRKGEKGEWRGRERGERGVEWEKGR